MARTHGTSGRTSGRSPLEPESSTTLIGVHTCSAASTTMLNLKPTGGLVNGHSSVQTTRARSVKIPDQPIHCVCSGIPLLQTGDHIIRDCPLYEWGRSTLTTQFPPLQIPRFQLSSLFRRDRQPHLTWWLKGGGAFTERGIPWGGIPTDPHDPGPLTSPMSSPTISPQPRWLTLPDEPHPYFLSSSCLESNPPIGCNYPCGRRRNLSTAFR